MGLKINEAFIDIWYIIDSTGAEITSASPTCTIYDESNNSSTGTVTEIGNGLYRCSFTPDAVGIWKLRWRVTSGTYTSGATHYFLVGSGQEADIVNWTQYNSGSLIDDIAQDRFASGSLLDLISQTRNVSSGSISSQVQFTSGSLIDNVAQSRSQSGSIADLVSQTRYISGSTGTQQWEPICWSIDTGSFNITTTPTNIMMPILIVPTAKFPATATVQWAEAIVKISIFKDTSGLNNAINTGSMIFQVDSDSSFGSPVIAIEIPNNSWATSGSTERGGTVLIGTGSVHTEVSGAGLYYGRLLNCVADGNNLQVLDSSWGIRLSLSK